MAENIGVAVAAELDGSLDTAAKRSRRNDITRDMRKAKAVERAAKNVAAWSQLATTMKNYRDDITNIARENDVSVNALKRKALHVSAIKPNRKTNNYNAYRRFRKLDLQSHRFSGSIVLSTCTTVYLQTFLA